jgi:hypothetical protein
MKRADLNRSDLDRRVAADFSRARARAFLNSIAAFVRGENNGLLAFHEVQHSLQLHEEQYVGIQSVELVSIVGSVNRHRDFERSFLPVRASSAERWKRVNRAYYESIHLPPPILLRVDDSYFVYDGHNRVSVARWHAIQWLEADVVEYRTSPALNTALQRSLQTTA